MKGIVLAAGKGTRLYPMTLPVCKPLLPVYDKPLIYYPVSVLMQAGIREILVIVPPGEESVLQALMGFAVGILVGADFIGDDSVCLVLGDNIFHQERLPALLKQAAEQQAGATVFGYYVEDPRPFGVVEFGPDGMARSIEEKPQNPRSNYIIPGLYFYDNQVIEIARRLKPSARGELEITDVNLAYLNQGQLKVITLDRDFVWLDAGTADSVLEASETVRDIQRATGRYVGCIEELAQKEGWITLEQVHNLGEALAKTRYGQYLLGLSR